MNAKHQRFVEEYLVDLNATQAAMRAGYSEKTARAQGSRLLTKADIAAAVARGMESRAARLELTQDWVLERLRENVQRALQRVAVLDHEGNPTGEYRYEGAVVNKAVELVGKHLGMFVEKHEHTGKGGAPLVPMDVVEAVLRARRPAA